ncbi:hypothetical protein [Lentzea atacamensis]|uniref:hypothetical protein n=1 Tax=Lentzea atacamensis TaxID=531938 RepID=UPI0011BFAD66|nr:hypothetical protein [Lentzea atacamensis]
MPVVRADWRTLPPLQRVVSAHPLINPVSAFSSRLTAWQNPSFLAPLAHAVGPAEPSGSISDVAAPAQEPSEWKPVWGDVSGPSGSGGPVVSRMLAAEPPAPVVSRSAADSAEPGGSALQALGAVAEDSPPPTVGAAVQRSAAEEPPRPVPPSRPRRLGLGEPISSVLQRSAGPDGSEAGRAADPTKATPSAPQRAADSGGAVEPVTPQAGRPSVQRLADAPRTPGLGMPVVRQPSESGAADSAGGSSSSEHAGHGGELTSAGDLDLVPTTGDATAASVSEAGESAPTAGFTDQLPVLDPGVSGTGAGDSSASGVEPGAGSAGPPTDVLQRAVDSSRDVAERAALPMVQRVSGSGISAAGTPGARQSDAGSGTAGLPAVQRVVATSHVSPTTSDVGPSAVQRVAGADHVSPTTSDGGPSAVQRVAETGHVSPTTSDSGSPAVAGTDHVSRTASGGGPPAVQRLVGDAPSLPVLGRPTAADSSATPEASASGGTDLGTGSGTAIPSVQTMGDLGGPSASTTSRPDAPSSSTTADSAVPATANSGGPSAPIAADSAVPSVLTTAHFRAPIATDSAVPSAQTVAGFGASSAPAAADSAVPSVQAAGDFGTPSVQTAADFGASSAPIAADSAVPSVLSAANFGTPSAAIAAGSAMPATANFGGPSAPTAADSAVPSVQTVADFGASSAPIAADSAVPSVLSAANLGAPYASTGPGEPVAQRLVGTAPSLPIVSRTDAAPTAPTATFTEPAPAPAPAVQRLVGSAPPLVQRAPQTPIPPAAAPSAGPLGQAQPALPVVVARAPDPEPAPAPEPVQRVVETTVQRAEAAQPEAPQPGPGAPAGQNADELLRKLYDPLLRRLKADLWLDRERRGALTDL